MPKKSPKKDIFDLPLKKITLYQVQDSEENHLGVLAANVNPNQIEDFREAFEEEDGDIEDIEAFASYLTKEGFLADRIYLEGVTV